MSLRHNWPTSSADETPPPPYSKYQEAPMAEAPLAMRKSQGYARPQPEPIPETGLFPQSWNLYHTMSWSGQPDLVLHHGPSDTLPSLAAGTGGVGVGRHSVIVLPALPGSRLDSSQEMLLRVDDDGGAARKTWRVRFRFAIEVGSEPGSAWRREVFEWRHSHGDAVSAFLDGAKTGWKLVRLANGDEDGRAENSRRLVWPRSSDGCEILAVWSHARLSLTKVLKFRFLGSGATGVLGERWAIMAVMTALRMYQHHQRNRNGDW